MEAFTHPFCDRADRYLTELNQNDDSLFTEMSQYKALSLAQIYRSERDANPRDWLRLVRGVG